MAWVEETHETIEHENVAAQEEDSKANVKLVQDEKTGVPAPAGVQEGQHGFCMVVLEDTKRDFDEARRRCNDRWLVGRKNWLD